MKKFEFTGETKVCWTGAILHRIKALVRIDLGWRIVEVGELGGWLEKEGNLSHDGNAWVSGDAEVCGNAKVCGNAWVSKYEHILVVGPIGSRAAYTTFTRCRDGVMKVKCGCFFGTIEEFLAKVNQTHGESKHALVYKAAVELARAHIDLTADND